MLIVRVSNPIIGETVVGLLLCTLLTGQEPFVDPVMKARAERARALKISEDDLPPVPRGIIEPPPLPPPQIHPKDARKRGKLPKSVKNLGKKSKKGRR